MLTMERPATRRVGNKPRSGTPNSNTHLVVGELSQLAVAALRVPSVWKEHVLQVVDAVHGAVLAARVEHLQVPLAQPAQRVEETKKTTEKRCLSQLACWCQAARRRRLPTLQPLPVGTGNLLVRGVAVDDVVVARKRGAAPQHHGQKASHAQRLQVANDDFWVTQATAFGCGGGGTTGRRGGQGERA
jgi:hypothetical protein